MRFLPEGPNIPDDLLNARDEGRVVFFCGAGVSRARAGLSDFFGLAESVIDSLGVSADSPERKLLKEAQDLSQRTGEGGLISADRIFGLLERDFLVRDVESTVAQALKPSDKVDLTAHQVLLDLARTPEGKVKLVTTNFDRLFEQWDSSLEVWNPPRLPDPLRQAEMHGIIHLHGCVNEDYTGSQGDGFVLSSSQFGRAYLAEGWATAFIRQILDRYVVVFVGYTADDPPIQYLMEALYKQSGTFDGVYAFQAGVDIEVRAKWSHKGVEAISYNYNESDGHVALWQTLEAWAKRARDPDAWEKKIIELAKGGPQRLQSHERGQVAHLVSSLKGMKGFAEDEDPPPAEWLCVFDPSQRYAKPGYLDGVEQQGPIVDPFDSYGLDSDSVPEKISKEYLYFDDRQVPSSSWDCFTVHSLDRKNLRDDNLPAFRGKWDANPPSLPPRLFEIGAWISKIASQPASVWWAAKQVGIHPQIQKQIQLQLYRFSNRCSPVVRQAWHYLFEAWATQSKDPDEDWYDLKALIEKVGWNNSTVRKFARINCPYLRVGKNYVEPKPPESKDEIELNHLVCLEVAYPNQGYDELIPPDWLIFTIREFRKNLELAVSLENELGGFGLTRIVPIVPDTDPSIDLSQRIHGLSFSIIYFSSLFERLISLNLSAARQEFATWPVDDESIFARIRIWTSGKIELFSGQEFLTHISALSDEVFWRWDHQRDLLVALANRWNSLEEAMRQSIEARLLRGPTKPDDDVDEKFAKRKARASLDRLQWLKDQDCHFTFDFDMQMQQLRSLEPNWSPDDARRAAESIEVRGGTVQYNTEHSILLELPLHCLLAKANELGGPTNDFLVKNVPFAGLSAQRPVRAFSALTRSAKDGEYPSWAWETFLTSDARRKDRPKFVALIAKRILSYPDRNIAELIRPLSEWLLTSPVASEFQNTFDELVPKLIDIIRLDPSLSKTTTVRRENKPDWDEASRAPVGKIAKALMGDPRIANIVDDAGLPSDWLSHVKNLLALKGDLRRYTLVIFAYNMNWFFAKFPEWTEQNMLAILDQQNHEDRIAVWCGFFWGLGSIPTPKLFKRMKSNFLQLAKEQCLNIDRYNPEAFSGIIFWGWLSIDDASGKRFLSNDEMRTVLLWASEEFWLSTLEHLEKLNNENDFEEFMREVWPRQTKVKTPRVSHRFVALLISKPTLFSRRAKVVLPVLTPFDKRPLWSLPLQNSQDTIVAQHPEQVLTLLHAVLSPGNAEAWPYGVETIIRRIGEADNTLKSDERWVELNRKWNAR